MKKLLSFILSASMLCTLIPSASALIPNYKWTFEDFENSDVVITSSNASATWTSGGVGDSAGCVHVKASKDYGTVKFNTYIEKDQTYKLSAWVKIGGTIPTSGNFQFLFYMHSVDSAGVVSDSANAYVMATATEVPYAHDWVYVETTYKHNGKARIAGQGDVNTADGSSTVEIRLGDGKMSNTTGGDPFDYYIDDFTVEPIFEQGADTRKDTSIGLKNGNFDNGFDSSCWSVVNATAETIDDGYVSSAVRVTSTASYGTIKQTAPIDYNKAYRISLMARAGDSDTVGKSLKLILDRTVGKTDESITENYEYLPSGAISSNTDDLVLSDTWQKLEVIYKSSKSTYETTEPLIYPRVGTGTETYSVDLDEWEVEELPDAFYNGDFTASLGKEWLTNGTTPSLTVSDDAPDGYTKSANFTGKGYGTYFYQGVSITKGEHCKLSFWAKSNTGDLDFTPVLSRDSYSTEYLYSDGISQSNNDSALTKSKMTNEWQHFEYDYTESTGASPYRVPLFYLRCGARSTALDYNATGFSIERYNDTPGGGTAPDTTPQVVSMDYTGANIEGRTLVFTAEVSNADASFYRILKEYQDTYISVGSGCFTGEAITYTIKKTDIGSKLRCMVMPISSDGELGKYRYIELGSIMAMLNLTPTLNAVFDGTSTATLKIKNNNTTSSQVFAILALFDASNAMLDYVSKGDTVEPNTSETISIEIPTASQATRVNLFVWSGIDEFNTKGKSLVSSITVQK